VTVAQQWEYRVMYWGEMRVVFCSTPASTVRALTQRGEADLDAWHRTLAELGQGGWEVVAVLPYGNTAELYLN
jgi:hypothetical protein